ncbi:MAG: ketoacyl-ACP synthase III [Acidimicrobiales bacterium]|nr:MAG: ketoacyl-ACP synthase III [Acidimicrobiales bacterium]|tara:strand:- start:3231 stop:4175 length:945 start_codon:yes stop_codon:yes gene_type:complete
MTSTAAAGARMLSVGTALPDKVLTNHDLEEMVDTSHQWIVERSGIHERRIGGTTAGLAAEAAQMAIERSGIDPASIDLLILATTSPDRQVPATASTVQEILGLRCGAMDLNAACSGFVYGLIAAHGFIQMGHSRILVIGAETLSRITDWTDRSTCILFADGAGAAIIEKTDGPGDLHGWHVDSNGALEESLFCDFDGKIQMAGQSIFKNAVLAMENAARKSLEMAELSSDAIDLVIPHQANVRIVEASCKRLGIPYEKASMVIHRTGNTSSASIPLALEDAWVQGRVQKGDNLLLVGFGAGMTSAAAVITWDGI